MLCASVPCNVPVVRRWWVVALTRGLQTCDRGHVTLFPNGRHDPGALGPSEGFIPQLVQKLLGLPEPGRHGSILRAFSVRFESEGFPKSCQCASLTALIRLGGNNAEAVLDGPA
jgi:hypothetical protein